MLPRASVAAGRIVEVLQTKPAILEAKDPVAFDPARKGQVSFQHVSFRYPGAEEEVLHDLSFTCEPGKTTAFIGSTGSGKSTIVNLVPRFFDVTEGKILVDGVDLREADIHDLRDRIGYVPQKASLFSGTIESNLRYANEDATDEQLKEAVKIAQALDFIEAKRTVSQVRLPRAEPMFPVDSVSVYRLPERSLNSLRSLSLMIPSRPWTSRPMPS